MVDQFKNTTYNTKIFTTMKTSNHRVLRTATLHPSVNNFSLIFIAIGLLLYSCSNEEFEEQTFESSVTTTSKLSTSSIQLDIDEVSASAVQNPNIPQNVLLDDESRWSGNGTAVDFVVDLGNIAFVDYAKIAFYRGDTRTHSFDVYTGSPNSWTYLNSKTSNGITEELEDFDLTNTTTRYLRFVFKGNSTNSWNSVTRLEIWGEPDELDEPSNDTYDAPYDIPRFKDAISKSKFQAPKSNTAATASQLMSGYSSNYFQVVDNDKIAFYQTGASNRSELRFENNWNVNNGTRIAHANLKFISQAGEQTTFIQIHDDANVGNGPNKPLLRMYRKLSNNHIWAAIKTNSGGITTTHIDCGITPTDYFDCDVIISGGTMTIKINGTTKAVRNVSYWDYPSYWKAGVYNQNSGGTTIYFNELTWN